MMSEKVFHSINPAKSAEPTFPYLLCTCFAPVLQGMRAFVGSIQVVFIQHFLLRSGIPCVLLHVAMLQFNQI